MHRCSRAVQLCWLRGCNGRPTAAPSLFAPQVCRAEAENAKVSVRHARKAAMDAAKKLASEDERKRVSALVPDRFNARPDALC